MSLADFLGTILSGSTGPASWTPGINPAANGPVAGTPGFNPEAPNWQVPTDGGAMPVPGVSLRDPLSPQRQALGGPATPGAVRMATEGRQTKRDSGLRRFLGNLGDALLVGAGGEPIYRPSVERREMGDALASYLGDSDAQLAEIMRRDPRTGLALLKMKQDAMPGGQDPTALMQNMEYLRRLNPNLTPQQLAEIAQYAIAAPRMYGSPELGWSPDPNYPFQRGEPPSPQQETAPVIVNPQTGEKRVLRNGQWVPMGGAGSNAGGGF